jgi:hypothetical protein
MGLIWYEDIGDKAHKMAWLAFYAAGSDWDELLRHLNESDEIAFIISDGPGRWIAVKTLETLGGDRICLWHVPSGPLPLLHPDGSYSSIGDPFSGWTELRAGMDRSQPYFGAGHPGVFWLNIRPQGIDRQLDTASVGLSSFEWIGNHYRIIGRPAKPETEQFWKKLKAWMKKRAIRVPRGGPLQHTKSEIWALNEALAMFNTGAVGENNP